MRLPPMLCPKAFEYAVVCPSGAVALVSARVQAMPKVNFSQSRVRPSL